MRRTRRQAARNHKYNYCEDSSNEIYGSEYGDGGGFGGNKKKTGAKNGGDPSEFTMGKNEHDSSFAEDDIYDEAMSNDGAFGGGGKRWAGAAS